MKIVEHDDMGRILSVISYPTSDKSIVEFPSYKDRLFLAPGHMVDWTEDYVLNGDITKRPVMSVELLGCELVGVPDGATIYIEESTYVTDGSSRIELGFSVPGIYVVKVSKWPFIEKEFVYEDISSGGV